MATPQIFISYARADARHADNSDRLLTAVGYRTWVDRQQVAVGQHWRQELAQAIAASQVLLLLWSARAAQSPIVVQEWQLALSRQIPIIIVRLDSQRAVPAELAHLPQVDGQVGDNLGALLLDTLDQVGQMIAPPQVGFDSAHPYYLTRALGPHPPPGWVVVQQPVAPRIRQMVSVLVLLLAAGYLGARGVFAILHDWLAPIVIKVPQAVVWEVLFGVLGAALLVLWSWCLVWMVYYLQALARQQLLPPTLVLFPAGVAAINFPGRMRTFPFATVAAITPLPRRSAAPLALSLIEKGTGKQGGINLFWIERRQRPAIVQQIVAAHSAAAAAPSVVGLAPLPVPAPPPAMPHSPAYYSVVAATTDGALLGGIQQWLAQRGIFEIPNSRMLAGTVLLPAPEALRSSRFVLVIASATVTQAPQTQALLAEMGARNLPLLPIRVQPDTVLPGAFHEIQWIDFNASVEPMTSFVALSNALDQLHLLPEPPDWETTLARAAFQRAPASWTIFRPATQTRLAQRTTLLHTTRWVLAVLMTIAAIVGIRSVLTIIRDGQAQAVISPEPWQIFLPLVPPILAICYGLQTLRMRARLRFWRHVNRLAFVPEVVVLTDQAVGVHLLDRYQRRFQDVLVPYQAIAAITTPPDPRGVTVVLHLHNQQQVILQLDSLERDMVFAAERITAVVKAHLGAVSTS